MSGEDIPAVILRYASGIDRRDWALLRSCFTEDCVADYGDVGTWHGAAELADFMARAHEGCPHTLHRITNITVEADGEDGASARSYVDAVIIGPGGTGGGAHVIGYYDDELVRTGEGWRIARRRFTKVRLEMLAGTAD